MALLSERRYISQTSIQSGMIVQFNYTKLNGDSNQYTVLVIDPNRTNKHASQPQLHGYNLEDMSDEEIINLAGVFKKTININPETRNEPLVEELNSSDAYENFSNSVFYDDRKYRTFNINAMSQVRQVLISSPT